MINGISASEAIINVDSNDDHNFIVTDSIKESNNSIVTYKDVLGVATELCRTVANDQKLAKATYVTIHEWINKIRSGDNIKVVFQNHTIKSVTENARTSQSCSTALPRAAVISTTTPGRKRRGRFKSSEELRRGNIHHAYMHKMNDNISLNPNVTTKTNELSKKKGCTNDELFVAQSNLKNCTVSYAVNQDVQGGSVKYCNNLRRCQVGFCVKMIRMQEIN